MSTRAHIHVLWCFVFSLLLLGCGGDEGDEASIDLAWGFEVTVLPEDGFALEDGFPTPPDVAQASPGDTLDDVGDGVGADAYVETSTTDADMEGVDVSPDVPVQPDTVTHPDGADDTSTPSCQEDPSLCDDANPCTDDICHETFGCINVSKEDETPCVTTSECPQDGFCISGVCITTDPPCEDHNPCTYDECVVGTGCVHTPKDGPCDDGIPTTVNDTCQDGVCVGECAPSCEGKECGDDGCGGSCGECPAYTTCEGGLCVSTCPPECPPMEGCSGPTAFGGHAYYFCASNKRFGEASDACEAMGGHLVTITSSDEDEFVHGLVTSGQDIWIGLTDKDSEGAFYWVNGESYTYTNWGEGQPDDSWGEDCVEKYGGSGFWNDNDCKQKNSFVCEVSG